MCGIAGAYTGVPSQDEVDFDGVISKLNHRGPDDTGVWHDQNYGLTLAHTRLSILDLSEAGHQPMPSHCGRYRLVFNGEIYNHLSLRKSIESEQNIAWRGHSDTETLLACFSIWGLDASIKKIKGMFAFALWDSKEQALFLVRDRLGEKPLYYGWQDDTFVFASELKALKAHKAFLSEIDREALSLYLRYNYVPAPYSIYKGIKKLLPGSYLRVDLTDREVEPKPYWSIVSVASNYEKAEVESDEKAVELLDTKLSSVVESQMLSDVPLGALLSGGIDSSLIVSLMQKQSDVPIETFTIGFDNKIYNESEHAREIARYLGTHHTEIELGSDKALDLIPSLPSVYDEPFADSSQLPTMMVMQLAREQVKVALSGDGGDELFGGYNRYTHAPSVWGRYNQLPRFLRPVFIKALKALPVESFNQLSGFLGHAQLGDKLQKLGRKLDGIDSIEDFFLSLATEWTGENNPVIGSSITNHSMINEKSWPNFNDPVVNMMLFDSRTFLPDDILVKVDRAAMATSLETRAPFLDKDLVEFAWALPMEMKIRQGKGKWILRELLNRYLPEDITNRPKMGFAVPLDEWLRGPLKDWADELLNQQRIEREGYFNSFQIAEIWNLHRSGKMNCGYKLWSVLMFQSWLDAESIT